MRKTNKNDNINFCVMFNIPNPIVCVCDSV